VKQLGGIKRLTRQLMDFLLLLSSAIRIVIEVDGKQHFANDDTASLPKYDERG
jgi:very-short-patch-repair endonuclease